MGKLRNSNKRVKRKGGKVETSGDSDGKSVSKLCNLQSSMKPSFDKMQFNKNKRKSTESSVKDEINNSVNGKDKKVSQHSRMETKQLLGPLGNKIVRFSDSDDEGECGEHTFVRKKWYSTVSEGPESFKVLAEAEIHQLKQEAKALLENDTLHHKNSGFKGPGRSGNEWLQTMWRKGTSQDRVAAGVIIVQNSPIHGLSILRSMISLVKPGRKECLNAMDVLSDLFISDLLIAKRKLKPFEKHPHTLLDEMSAGNLPTRKLYLMSWYFEDQLKIEYQQFIQNILLVARDCVENTKEKAVLIMQKLLAGNAEREVLLLSSLVNKLGDPSQKVSSKVIFCLSKLLHEHPNMKMVVTEEIEKLLFRSNISKRAQYYAFCLLTQFILTKDEADLALKLIQLYFSFFKSCVKKGEVDSRMMNILLTGVNRAYPFAKQEMSRVSEHIEMLYKVVHMAHLGVSLHALYLLYQVADYDTGISDRFYSALYRKLLDLELAKTSHHALFLNLIFRAMSKDVQDSRIKAFIKRLLQICHYVPVPLTCGILITVSEIITINKNLSALTMFVTNFKTGEDEDSEEEQYTDIKLEEEESTTGNTVQIPEVVVEETEEKKPEVPVIPSWYHYKNSMKRQSDSHGYNAYARNPLFTGGEICVYTELVNLATHFHPTVSLFASRLLHGEKIEYLGDPLNDFTLSKFLERFVFRNPKKVEKESQETAFSKLSRKWSYKPKGFRNLPIKSEQYMSAAESSIPVEEVFMHKFLKKKQWKKAEEDNDSDTSSVTDEDFDKMLNQLLAGKEQIDFADGIGKIPSKKEKDTKEDEDSGDESGDISDGDDDGEMEMKELTDDDDDFDNDNDDDDDIMFDGDEEEEKNFKFSMSDVENDDDDEEDDDDLCVNDSIKDSNFKKKYFVGKEEKGKSKGKSGVDGSIFASADEFSQILEDTGDFHAKHKSLANLSNKDNAAVKQLKWEMSQNNWFQRHGEKGRKRSKKPGVKVSKKFRRK